MPLLPMEVEVVAKEKVLPMEVEVVATKEKTAVLSSENEIPDITKPLEKKISMRAFKRQVSAGGA